MFAECEVEKTYSVLTLSLAKVAIDSGLFFPYYIISRFAGIAQLAERQPSKLNVAGSSPVSRSRI